MVNNSSLKYAMRRLTLIGKENGFKVYFEEAVDKTTNKGIFIEFPSGINLSLSENEIIYQAMEYLKSEISVCMHG